jgi:hypothetical protein
LPDAPTTTETRGKSLIDGGDVMVVMERRDEEKMQ